MAKRSPILGYNHNVRYRGLIFHVQTEDSGVLSPHLFTHLFHAGVIVSTRKLVYDAGSDEGAIKSLMQAQHKAVMKDLKKGTFDEKIDQYLGGTPGLLPKGFADESQPMAPGRDSEPVLATEPVAQIAEPAPPAEIDATIRNQPAPALAADINATLRGQTPARASTAPPIKRPGSEPVVAPVPGTATSLDDDLDLGLGRFTGPPPKPTGNTRDMPRTWLDDPSDTDPQRNALPRATTQPDPPRTKTADRGSAPSRNNMMPPAPSENDGFDGPTNLDSGAVATAIAAAQNNATIRMPMPPEAGASDSMNQIIGLELEDTPSGRHRRDTDVILLGLEAEPASDGVPGVVGARPESRSRPNESVPPLPPPPAASRPSTSSGSLLPPRPPTRPAARPAMTPPQVMSRPLTRDSGREESDAVEVYAPAPPSADAPPGMPGERPGVYAQHKRVSQKMPAIEAPGRERSGAVPIPPGLGRPGSGKLHPQSQPVVRPTPPPTPPPREPKTTSQPVPSAVRNEPSSGAARPRTPTPGRPGSPPTRPGSSSGSIPNSGVVMTRPAVIVGAPAKPAQPSRVRKAREDEGRGFGQGLISEKSLDEVILAYLSEDADDK